MILFCTASIDHHHGQIFDTEFVTRTSPGEPNSLVHNRQHQVTCLGLVFLRFCICASDEACPIALLHSASSMNVSSPAAKPTT